MIERVCVAGAGVIGSLIAGHLASVADVSVLCRREEHARALNADGLRISGKAELTARVTAAVSPDALPEPDLVDHRDEGAGAGGRLRRRSRGGGRTRW